MTDVPGVDVPPGHCTLQIGYWDDGRGCRALQGEWGDEYLLDNHEYTNDGLTVFGLQEEPGTYGTLAAKWLERSTGDQPVRRIDHHLLGETKLVPQQPRNDRLHRGTTRTVDVDCVEFCCARCQIRL
ncbi:hypothetical protein [Georgenia sp. SUBG003]|uniref:hypothetical protein n=1 Tax=Georgenia sp. SUBG003 TaxID=1497974 RepID=UPI003AB79160